MGMHDSDKATATETGANQFPFDNPHMMLDVAVEIVAHDTAQACRRRREAEDRRDDAEATRWRDETIRLIGIRDDLYRGKEGLVESILAEARRKHQEELAEDETVVADNPDMPVDAKAISPQQDGGNDTDA